MTHLIETYKRFPVEFKKGEGVYLYDDFDKRYLDFTSGIGVCNLGYNSQVLNTCLKAQIDMLWHSPNIYESTLQEEVASYLSDDNRYRTFFCNSGAEANEAAIKLVRKHTNKEKIITFNQSFHGRTFASMTATGQGKIHDGFGTLLNGFHYAPYNDSEALKELVDEDTAAIMLEIIQGEGGVIPANKDWLQTIQKLCNEYGCLLVVDEVQTGIGRTGLLYSYQHYELQPDIITLAKGLGNGLPVGAMLANTHVSKTFGYGSHGSTFGGNRLSLTVAKEVLKTTRKQTFLDDVRQKGDFALSYLKNELTHEACVQDIRGKGLMIGIELNDDVLPIIERLMQRGLLVLQAGPKVIRLLPPLIIEKKELENGLEIIVEEIKQHS